MTASEDTGATNGTDERTTVLEVFGLKLSVKNRRLAEILTMDAAEALGFDRKLPEDAHGAAERPEHELIVEALPEVLLPVGGVEDDESRVRTDVREQADALVTGLGFDVLPGGRWQPPGAPLIHTRILVRTPTPAAAAHMVEKLADAVLGRSGSGESVLLVTSTPDAVPPLLTALDARGLQGSFRIVTVDDLERLAALCRRSPVPAAAAAAFLSPAAGVDVGLALDACETGRA